MKHIILRLLIPCLFLPLAAQTVTNGGVTGAPAANNGITLGYAPGWTRCAFSPDLCSTTFPSYSGSATVATAPSPDGGTWLGIAALGECAQTTITGLTVGASYTLYFCGSCFGTAALYNTAPAAPTITVGASAVTFSIPRTAATWYPYSMTFTANATSMVLQASIANGSNSYANLDGFSLSTPCGSPLPVSLEQFAASLSGTGAELNWSAPGDAEIALYSIEKLSADEQWTTLGTQSPEESHIYTYYDAHPLPGYTFYRLKVTDRNGNETYSELRFVRTNVPFAEIQVFPNPANETLHIRTTEERMPQVQVFNLVGQEMLCPVTPELAGMDLDIRSLEPGIYFVKLVLDGQTELRRLIVE